VPDVDGDFYRRLRRRLTEWMRTGGRRHRWAEWVLAGPDLFHLLCRLTLDRAVPAAEKAKLAIAIAYFVSPFDLLPEALTGPAGYVDDVALAAYVLHSVLQATDATVLRRHWAGERDVLEVIRRILGVAQRMVGKRRWGRLVGLVGGRGRRR
jgi:uncharacterized membrane protein YkvA (DUF1232 family)